MTGKKTVLLCGVVALLLCSACTKEEGQGNLLSVNYSFKWERAYWDIRNGVIGQAFYNGPKLGVAWDLSINKTSDKSILFATVHRAAMKFCYGNSLGVHRPVLADSKTKIAVKDENASWAEAVAYEFTKQHYLEERHLISSGLNTFDYRSQQGWYPGSVNGKSSCYNSVKSHKINGVTDHDVNNLFELYWGYEYVRPHLQ